MALPDHGLCEELGEWAETDHAYFQCFMRRGRHGVTVCVVFLGIDLLAVSTQRELCYGGNFRKSKRYNLHQLYWSHY